MNLNCRTALFALAIVGPYLGLASWIIAQPITYRSAQSTPPANVDPSLGMAWVYAVSPITAGNAPNCDGSSVAPVLNVLDFACFLNRFAGPGNAGPGYPLRNAWADCDQSGDIDVLDYACFINTFASGVEYTPPLIVTEGIVTFEHGTIRGIEIGSPKFDSSGGNQHTVMVFDPFAFPATITCTGNYLDITEVWHVFPLYPGGPDIKYVDYRLGR